MNLTEVLHQIAHDPDCTVFPAAGLPNVTSANVVPEDVRAFYELCGGLVIAHESPYEVRIVGPEQCVLANDVILGTFAAIAREQQSTDPSWNWYIIAEVENGNFLSIDFSQMQNGRCYDSFEETYGLVGQMPVIALSLTSLIGQLYGSKGKHWYWLEPGFQALGDAYDAT